MLVVFVSTVFTSGKQMRRFLSFESSIQTEFVGFVLVLKEADLKIKTNNQIAMVCYS